MCGGGGLASEYREGHLQWVHPLGDWRFYYDSRSFCTEEIHCSDLKIGRETVLKTLCWNVKLLKELVYKIELAIFKPMFKSYPQLRCGDILR